MFDFILQKKCGFFLLTALGSFAFVQSSAAQGTLKDTFDEIVVTATKKQDVETVQDVPIAVTAFNEDTLEVLKVRDLESLSFYSPNVSLDQVNTSRGTANFSIRGLGINSSIPSIDPAVGVFVDGVYSGTNGGVVFDLFDIESIEILRGPQGLLFGRNTTGGAVLINTTRPSDEFRQKFRISTDAPAESDRGSMNNTAQYLVAGPLSDTLRGKVSLYYNKDEGYFKNLFDGSDHGEAETFAVRFGVEWDAHDDLIINAKLDIFDSKGDGPASQNHGIYSRDSFDFSIDEKGSYDTGDSMSLTLRGDLDVDFGNGTITNIFGWTEVKGANTVGDIDAAPTHLFHSTSLSDNEQISNELRYAGTFGDYDMTAGVYWFDQDLSYDEHRNLIDGGVLAHGGGKQSHTVRAVFGQLDYHYTDKLTGIFGLRYSKEEKDAAVNYILGGDEPCSVVNGTCVYGPMDSLNGGFVDSNEWSNVTPKLGFQYAVDENSQTYGYYVKGFRSGGYNFRITDLAGYLTQIDAANGALGFDEEKVDSYELGHKYQSEDGRLSVNSAVFLTEIEDMQREVNLPSESAGVSQSILNTADATIHGLEVEAAWFVTEDLRLTGNVGLIDGEYDRLKFDLSGDGVVDAADLALDIPRLPETTYGIGFNWYKALQKGGEHRGYGKLAVS